MKDSKNRDDIIKIFDICGIIFSTFIIFFIWAVRANNQFTAGLMLLMEINILTCAIYGLTSKCKSSVLFSILVLINFLLLFNGNYYYIDLFWPASEILLGLVMFSIFTFLIPTATYFLFLYFLSKATYYLSNQDKFKTKEQKMKEQ